MGGTRSSSKRKSSKRKTSKISSEAPRKKRSRRTKSRKHHRRDDSSYFDDNSRSLVSVSSSGSEDEYCRVRSRTRREVKGSRKRSRGSSSSRGSSEDSRHAKKRKGSKRSSKSDTRKKSQKKKRKREPTVSSVSSDSQSCSTCQGGSRSGGKSDFERPRGRSREKSKHKQDSRKAKGGTKSKINRSRSCSSCSRYSGSSGHGSMDILPVQSSLGRLRSVITVTKSAEGEEKEWDKDGHKEEIVYDYDDYPSCRSNDSNDGCCKRESHVDPERRVENVKEKEAFISDIDHTKLTKSGEEGGVQDCQYNSPSDEAGANNSGKDNKTEVFASLSSSKGDDLESILRLKALENLRKYRGGLRTNAKPPADERNKSDSDVEQLSTAKVEFVQNRSPNEDGSRLVGATRVLDQNPRPTMGRNSSHPAPSCGQVQEGKGTVTDSGSAVQSVVCLPTQVAITGNSKEEDFSPAGAITSKSELDKSATRQESSGTILEQTHKANMLVPESNVNKSLAAMSKSVDQTSNNNGVGVNNVHESSTSEPSSLKPTLEEHSTKEQQGENKGGSQFEQKTMSVMRGGEMVQVSYKVYIPKKAPALARRQLRR